MAKSKWTVVPDQRVRHVWKDPDTGEEITVTPDFYEGSGTPISKEQGDDSEYLRTEVLQKKLKIVIGVEGGCVRCVKATPGFDIDVVLWDDDNKKAGGLSEAQRASGWNRLVKRLEEVLF